ncbi:hypothetical protein KDA00_02140 [Candidatus Saccharibacteria bacterium]|nr:hypothetical protein [Candidatus Saccharibacteria bacterium]
MNRKTEKKFILILQLTAVCAVIGIILLIITRWRSGPSAAFDLLAYVVSISALVMTTLQSISISRQVKITQEGAEKIEGASKKLEDLIASDKLMTRELKRDIKLDEENEEMVRNLYKEENDIEQKIESLITELKRIRK